MKENHVLTVDGYGIDFEYKDMFSKFTPTIPVKVTVCTLTNLKTGDVVNTGYAYLHPGERFSKKQGRKIALARAMSPLTKLQRYYIWTEYLHTVNF